jgi:cephalosporin-C deacetylase-like acetyl esterase
MNVTSEPVTETAKGYSCYNVKINCSGPKPAIGYFAKPKAAQAKSLPIILFFHSAGVKGIWCRSTPGNALYYAKMGALCFDLNAHGMLNNQPEEYYAGLENGELKDYPFQGIGNKKDFYFRGMYLRLMRTLDFLTKQPEWDGKRILVIGQSQGGGQALAAAGLDKRVTAVVATLPAMCDWGGNLDGRKGGWPNPMGSKEPESKLQVLPYFDTASLLKGTKARIFAEIGLIDNTCPSTSIYAALNQAKGEKTIIPIPYLGHTDVPVYYQKTWKENVEKKRLEFIADFLK